MPDRSREPSPPVAPVEAGRDAAPAPTPSSAEAEGPGVDLARRRFFRQFAGEMVQTAATVVGAAQALRETSAQAAQAILDPEQGATVVAGSAAVPVSPAPSTPTPGFRTAFRFGEADDVLLVIDQRRLPHDLVEYEVRSAPDAAFAIRESIVGGAPAVAQVAALGLALSAHRARQQNPLIRRATLRGGATALVAARPTAAALVRAVERLMARYEAVGGPDAAGETTARALLAEAEAIVAEATAAHGEIARHGVAALPATAGPALRVLTVGHAGTLAGGQFGTALGIVQAAHHAEVPVHVWVAESRPLLDGARLTAWELRGAGVSHAVVADAAAGGLVARGEVDVILVAAERVAANGDAAVPVGAYPVAAVAARHGVPFVVIAPSTAIDPATPAGSAIVNPERPPADLLLVNGRSIAPAGTEVRNPSVDVVPADLVAAIVTEAGVLRPPWGPALAAAVDHTDRTQAGTAPATATSAPSAAAAVPAGAPPAPARASVAG